jgi:hypothetical protein
MVQCVLSISTTSQILDSSREHSVLVDWAAAELAEELAAASVVALVVV